VRLKELQLLKYGPFEDQVLRFPGRAPGLHIIFGQNEAGKSSALRGLKALLFGIARNTSDDFLFGNDLLSVGAVLQSDDGRECELQRWKAKPTLRDKNNKALTDTSFLARCLGGMDETSFERFYGLDYDELQEGSKMLLQEKGNVGTSIFSAGLGALDVRKVLTDLEEKAGLLFKAKAKNPTLNKLISDYNQKKSEIKAASLTVKVFQEKEDQYREAEGKLECLRLLQKDLHARKTKLERIRRTRPMIAELNEFELQLKDLGDVAPLPDGFIDERRKLTERQRQLHDEIAERSRDLESIQEDIAKLHLPTGVLEHAAAIIDLQKALTSYVDARRDLPGLKAKATKAREEAEFILKILRPGIPLSGAEAVRLRPDHVARIQSLGGEEKTLRKTHDTLVLEVLELEEELKQGKDKLAQLPQALVTERTSALVSRIQNEGNLERKLADEKEQLKRRRDEAEIALKRLQFWNGTLDQLAELKVPGVETITSFEQRTQLKENERAALTTQIAGIERTLAESRQELVRLQKSGGDIPTARQLAAAREQRESAWDLIQRAWLKGEDIDQKAAAILPPLALPDAFEKLVRDADTIADNRFRDATRVSQHEDRIQRIESAEIELGKLHVEKREREVELDQIRAAWHERWKTLGVEAGSIPEMRNWLVQRNDLVQRSMDVRNSARDCDVLATSIQHRITEVSSSLEQCGAEPCAAGSGLNDVLNRALSFCKKQELQKFERKTLEDRTEETGRNWRRKVTARDCAKTKLDEWKEKWADAVAVLGLRPDALVHEAEQTLAKIRDLFDKLDPIPEAEKRIASVEQAIVQFEKQSAELVLKIDPSLGQFHPDQATEALNERLIVVRSSQAKREQLIKQSDESARKNERADGEVEAIKKRLHDMCDTAECGEPAELDAVERRSELFRALQKKIDETKKSILNAGDGWGLADLLAEPSDVHSDELDAQHAQTHTGLAELEAEFHSAHEAKARLKSERDAMDGKANAADAAAQAQCIVAQIRDESEQYVRLRMAAELLRREIDRYREENQTPLLRHASAIFAKLTCGGYSGVRADLDEQGRNALMSIRKDGRLLGVEGMSDGTRDQLYLALRLAFLPLYLEKEENEPLPFVIDDVLINFDDTRCAAAFKFLYETSARVQVIVFTHHKHIVDLAKHALPEATCQHEGLQTLEVFSFGSSEG